MNNIKLYPSTFGIHPTSNCNLNCRMCDTGFVGRGSALLQRNVSIRPNKKEKNLSINQWSDIFHQIKNFSPNNSISVSGGEPFLYENIRDLLLKISEHGLGIRLVTNGFFISENLPWLTDLSSDPSFNLVVSIDGPEKIHDKIRGLKGAYNKALSGLDMLLSGSEKLKLSFTTTITDYNVGSLRDTVDTLLQRYGDNVYSYSIYHPWHRPNLVVDLHNKECEKYLTYSANSNYIDYPNIDIITLASDLDEIMHEFKFVTIVPMLKRELIDLYYKNPEKKVIDKETCSAPLRKVLITPTGNVLVNALCFAGILGNLKEQSLLDIFNGEKFENFRNCISNKIYPACYRCCDLFM